MNSQEVMRLERRPDNGDYIDPSYTLQWVFADSCYRKLRSIFPAPPYQYGAELVVYLSISW
ncbi:hypothetical protein J2Y86_000087 [Pseudomonas migulae]|nr:hypothetical protein [Pseudomonas migulae]